MRVKERTSQAFFDDFLPLDNEMELYKRLVFPALKNDPSIIILENVCILHGLLYLENTVTKPSPKISKHNINDLLFNYSIKLCP